jgi:hypothetical protein
MNRAERRKIEKEHRADISRNTVRVDRREIKAREEKLKDDLGTYYVETLMTCLAVAEHRMHGFGKKRILKTLQCIDDMMGEINSGDLTIDDLRQELSDEVGLSVRI